MAVGNTAKDGTGTYYDLLVTNDGRLIVVGAAAEDAAVTGEPVLIGGRHDATPRSLDDGDVGAVALSADGQLLVDDGWRTELQSDTDTGDSDKAIAVTAAEEWEVMTIYVDYTASGDAGNRVLGIEFRDDSANILWAWRSAATQAASEHRYYSLGQGHGLELTSFRDTNQLFASLPKIILPATYDIHVWDTDAIAAAADDMHVYITVRVRTV